MEKNTTYRTFLGFVIGLNRPDTSLLIDIAFNFVENRSCFIVSNKNFTDVITKSLHYNEIETKDLILNTPILNPVYIRGPIASKLLRITVTNDYTNCTGNSSDGGLNELININKINGNNIDPNDPCIQKIYTTSYIDACFYSKDFNYNPY